MSILNLADVFMETGNFFAVIAMIYDGYEKNKNIRRKSRYKIQNAFSRCY